VRLNFYISSLLLFLIVSPAVSFSVYAQALRQTGIASFYSDKFNGKKTASGKIFNNKKFYAAHKTLPFGTILKVTNLSNNKWCLVTVIDRGPFIKGRIIDLSKAAADSLDYLHVGHTKVLIEEITEDNERHLLPPVHRVLSFPYSWKGVWSGNLQLFNQAGLKLTVPMKLHILPTADTSRWHWVIQYDTSKRNYELIIDEFKKEYFIDEKNSIVIPASLFDNTLVSCFEVAGSTLQASYSKMDDELLFTISSLNTSLKDKSGGIVYEGEEIPIVESYRVVSFQRAILQRE
jgi:3D (Asp-Asp-Asp) domain-containing protein